MAAELNKPVAIRALVLHPDIKTPNGDNFQGMLGGCREK